MHRVIVQGRGGATTFESNEAFEYSFLVDGTGTLIVTQQANKDEDSVAEPFAAFASGRWDEARHNEWDGATDD